MFIHSFYLHKIFSNVIGDPSFIGIDCESGIIDDCNDGTQESVSDECSGIFMAPNKPTRCGSQCSLNTTRTRENYKCNSKDDDGYWLLYKSQVP